MNAATLKKRLGFGSAMILILGGLFYFDFQPQSWKTNGLLVTCVLTALLLVGVLEMRKLVRSAGYDILPITTFIGILAMILNAYLFSANRLQSYLAIKPDIMADILRSMEILRLATIPCLLAFLFLEQMLRHRTEQAIQHVMASLLTIAYIGLLGVALLTIRLAHGPAIFVAFLLIVKSADIGAFFVGSAIGRNKLMPTISPKKSWEGLFGGLAFSALAAIGAQWLIQDGFTDSNVNAPHIMYQAPFYLAPMWMIALFGATLGLIGQFGDWCESLLKRSAGVKDSASLIPEFGGVLDLLDSPLIAAPFFPILFYVLQEISPPIPM